MHLGLALSISAVCGGSVTTPAPTTSSLSVASATRFSGAQTVTVNGANLTGATGYVDGVAVSTTPISSTQVSITIPATVTREAGAKSVTVVTAGGTSNAQTFTVTQPTWLKALARADRNVTASGGSISSITTDDANGRTWSQATGTKQPTRVAASANFNNAPVFSFDGGDCLIDGGAASFYNFIAQNTGSVAIYTAARTADASPETQYVIFDCAAFSAANVGAWMYYDDGGAAENRLVFRVGNTSTFAIGVTSADQFFDPQTVKMFRVKYDLNVFTGCCTVSATGETDIVVNRGAAASANPVTQPFAFGSNSAGTGSFFKGEVPFIALCSPQPSTAEENELKAWAQAIWGVSL